MAAKPNGHALRRKTDATRRMVEEREVSPTKALRLSMARAADETLDLALNVREISMQKRALEPLVEDLSDEMCLILLEGPLGSRGMIALDLATIVSLVEVQTTGIVGSDEVEARPITSTDSALAQPLVDGVLSRFESLLAHTNKTEWTRDYRYGSRMAELRVVSLLLEDLPYNVFKLKVDINMGVRQGEVILALPMEPRQIVPHGPDPAKRERRVKLTQMVQVLPAELNAVLAKPRLSWEKLHGLTPGDVIELPRSALSEVLLESEGKPLTRAKLGRMEGLRAVRICATRAAAMPNMFADLDGDGGAAAMAALPDMTGGFGDMSASEDEGMPDLPDLPSFDDNEEPGELPDLPELPSLDD